MKLFTQDDYYDLLNQPKRKFKFKHNITSKIIKAENKKQAIKLFLEIYNIQTTKNTINQI